MSSKALQAGFALLIFIGFFINFIPTINYFVNVNPHLKSAPVGKGSFMNYSMNLFLAFVNVSKGKGAVVLIIRNGSLSLKAVNNTYFMFKASARLTISYPLNRSGANIMLRSSGLLRRDSPLGRVIYLDRTSNYSVRILENHELPLERVPLNIISIKEMLNPRFYLKPVGYHGNCDIINEHLRSNFWLNYFELSCGGLLLTLYYSVIHVADHHLSLLAEDGVLRQVLEEFLSNDKQLLKFVETHSTRIVDADLTLGLINTNVRFDNDVLGRILFDFTVTYFPVNVVLIAAGLIGLVLLARRRL